MTDTVQDYFAYVGEYMRRVWDRDLELDRAYRTAIQRMCMGVQDHDRIREWLHPRVYVLSPVDDQAR